MDHNGKYFENHLNALKNLLLHSQIDSADIRKITCLSTKIYIVSFKNKWIQTFIWFCLYSNFHHSNSVVLKVRSQYNSNKEGIKSAVVIQHI